jgi:hypothetical protein
LQRKKCIQKYPKIRRGSALVATDQQATKKPVGYDEAAGYGSLEESKKGSGVFFGFFLVGL